MTSKEPNHKLPSRRLRAYERVNVSGDVVIHNEENLFIAPLANLSAGGCFVSGIETIAEGTEIKIVVRCKKLPHPVQARGTVVRVENGSRRGVAIEFTSITPKSRETIQTLVHELKMESALKIL